MDTIDSSIITLLQENARMASSEIAKQLDMAPSAIGERIKKLEERGIIQKYSAIVNPDALGLHVVAFVHIAIDSANWSDAISKQISSIQNVEELHEVIGEDSYFAKIRAKDMADLSSVLKKKIGGIAQIKSTKTVISTNVIKETPLYQTYQSN